MTQQNLVKDGKKGFVAIYEGPIDPAVEDNPIDHLDKLTFHSDLDYIGLPRVRKTYTLPAVSGSYFKSETVNLGPHGKPFTPIILAVLRDWDNGDGNPVDLPIGGGIDLDFYGQRPGASGTFTYRSAADHTDRWSGFFGRNTGYNDAWTQKLLNISVGVDGTNLLLNYEQAVRDNTPGAGYPAFPLTIDFYVGDRGVDGSSGDPAPNSLVLETADRLLVQTNRLTASGTVAGGFDSYNNYLHRDDVSPDFPIAVSDAVLFDSGVSGINAYRRFAMSFRPNWSFDVTEKVQRTPTIPSPPVPARVGLAL